MTTQIQSSSSRTRALWIIAISLVIIAVCLVLIVLKLHLQKSVSSAAPQESELAVPPPEPEEFPNPPTKPTNSSPRRPTTAVAYIPNPPTPELAALEPDAPPVEVSPEPEPRVAVVSRATHPGNTIIGRVTLRGTPPLERAIPLNSTPSCPELRTNPPTTLDFIVGTNGELANVFVSLAGRMNNAPSAASLTNHLLTLADCKVTPLLSGTLVSQALKFSNGSTDDHTLKIVTTNHPSAPNRPVLSQVILYSGLTRSRPAFRRPEDFIAIECAQHPWEFAYVCAVENSFFAVTDTNGGFVIPNVPTGKYLINARHLRLSGPNSLSREVIVQADQPTVIDFTFDLAASQ